MNNWPNWINTQSTGSQYPYYLNEDSKKNTFTFDINNILKEIPLEKRILEVSSVIEILHKGYVFGDQTLVKGIKRSPWMAKLNENEEWQYENIHKHSVNKDSDANIAKQLKALLYQEILNNIGHNKRVGILLSGGLDSRIIAGVLREAQLNGDFSGEVIVYNWGKKDSRDVVYAERIANLFNWTYIHFDITAESLKENFYNALTIGAEISPIHLHAIIKVRDDEHADIVIAGTYGDSLGRGLYSGAHFSDLNNLMQKNMNKLSLLKDSVVQDHRSEMESHYYNYGSNLKDNKLPYQLREVEQNSHYLRRMLGTAMSIISQRKPIYQLFTSPEIVEYMWGLDKTNRNDEAYKLVLQSLPSGIGEIPYAKTGKSFIIAESNVADDYSISFHEYSSWLKSDLKSFIDKNLNLNLLNYLGIFNEKSLEVISDIWPKADAISAKKIDGTICWLTTFSMFVEQNHIHNEQKYANSFQDNVNSLTIKPKLKAYELMKKI